MLYFNRLCFVLCVGYIASLVGKPAEAQGQALSLNGTDQYVEVADADALDLTTTYTLEAWVNVTQTSQHSTLFSKQGASATTGGLNLILRTDSRVEVEVRNVDFYQSPAILQNNQWQHVAVTFDDHATPKLRVFLNGAEVGSTSSISAPHALSTPLVIGRRGTGNYFGGQIEEARIWNVARTQAQIQGARSQALSGFETGLVGYYRFDAARNLKLNQDGTDDIFDHSPERNHGDMVGGASIVQQGSPIVTKVNATDDLFEDKVVVSWQRSSAAGSLVQITRNNQLLTSVSSQDSTFTDTAGDPKTAYEYCAILVSTGAVLGCDSGRRLLKAATNIVATDKAFTDKVMVSWNDNSTQNTHYRIFRDNVQIAEIAGTSTSYEDTSTLTLNQQYTYCVAPVQNGTEGGERACDTGEIGSVLPALDVVASDGTYPGYVRLTWKDQDTGATGFVIKRDGATLTTAAANATSYDDVTAVDGQTYTYCVARQQTGGAAAKDVCDSGSTGTLQAPINVTSSDGSFDDKIEVSWGNTSNTQSGFNVYRQGGYALTFDGIDDYVHVPDANGLDLTTALTLEGWFNISKAGDVTLFSKDGDADTHGAYNVYVLSDGRIEYEVNNVSSYQIATTIQRNQWHHIAVTFDDTAAPKLRVYLDGVEVGSTSTITAPLVVDTPLRLGRRGSGTYFGGQMDEVRIWNVARSRTQLRATMFGAPTSADLGLVSRWTLDDRTGTTARDVYGIHSGTLTNFALSTNESGWAISGAAVDLYGNGLALHLDGAGDYATANSVSSSFTTRATTVEAWIYPETQVSTGVIWTFTEALPNTNQQRILEYNGASNRLIYDDLAISPVTSKARLPLNRWHHVAVSIDADGNGTLYINGAADQIFTTTAQTATDARFSLGQAWTNSTANHFFTGRIDDVRLWNTARTAAEINTNRFGTVAATSTGLVADWRFDKVEDLGASASAASSKIAQATSFEIGGTFNDIRDLKGTAHANIVAGRLVQGRPKHMSTTSGNAFTDFDAAPGAGYRYCVSAYTVNGVETTLVCDAGTRGSILAVTDVKATDGTFEDKVDITWQNPGNRASAFIVYRNDTAIETVSATTLTYTDKTIASVTTFNYCVSAVSQEGIESAKVCDEGYREIKQLSQFQASVNGEEHRVTLQWQDESSIERGFKVYRRAYTDHTAGTLAADSALVVDLAVADQTQTYDLQGIPGTWYRYSIVAYDALGQSKSSLDDGLRTLSAPSLVQAADGESETQVLITWEDRSNAETGYRIFRGSTELGTVAANATQYTDTNPPLGVTSTYGIEAFDARGPSARETDTGATTIFAPGTVQASEVYTDKVVVTWADQSKVESGYHIFRDGTQVGNVGANVIDYTDNTAVVGTTYQYCVAAVSPAGGTSAQVCDNGVRAGTPVVSDLVPMQVRLFPDDGTAGDSFGKSVATASDQIMIGAPNDANGRGSVYVFDRTETGWQQSAKLVPSTGADDDQFGREVDMTETHAIIGAHRATNASDNERSGVVYFYERREGGWVETQRIDDTGPAEDAHHGFAVAIEGNWAIVGANRDDGGAGADIGSVTIYENVSGTWTKRFAVPSPFSEGGERFGYSVAIYDQWAAVGAIFGGSGDDGRVALYRRNGNQWTLFQTLRKNINNGAQFGRTIGIQNNYLIVGAIRNELPGGPTQEGAAYIYKFDETEAGACQDKQSVPQAGCWEEQQQLSSDNLLALGGFGQFVSLSGAFAVVGEVNEGDGANSNRVTHVYKRDANETWTRTAKLIATERNNSVEFATRVKISDAGTIISGDPLEAGTGGTAYVTELAPQAPTGVIATNGKFENRIAISWTDVSSNETGYHLYRDGTLIATLAADETSYDDYDALPGEVHNYCTTSFLTTGFGANTTDVDSPQVCDLGWRFPDGTIAGQILDSYGIGSDSTDVCLAPSPNGALMLDGVGGYVEMSDLTADWPAQFTIEQWIFTSDVSATQAFSFKGDTGSGWGGILTGGEVEFYFDGVNGVRSGTGHLQSNTWHHIALTYDGTTARIFIDGTERGSTNMALNVPNTEPYVVGRRQRTGHGSDLYFKGQIDDIRVWDHARTASQIQAAKDAALKGDELGLFAYWPADERASVYLANNVTSTRGKYYGTFNGGAYPSRPGAPLRACSMTDDDGNYAFAGIRYGESTEFTLTPKSATDSPHTYAPVRKKVKLSRELPVQNEITFADLTRFNIAGKVQYNNTQCFAENISMYLNGTVAEGTDVNGQFVLSNEPGAIVLEPRAASGDHTFAPTSRSFLLDGHKQAQNFTDLTTRKMVINVAGGSAACRKPVGEARVKVRALNGCFEQEYTTNASGQLTLDLPPLEYAVQVQDLTNPVQADQEVTIEAFFDDLGGLMADLSTESDTLEFIYRAPVQVDIQGLTASACTTGDIADKLPLLAKNDPLKLTFSVFEDYGGGNTCPVDEAKVVLFNEIGDTANAADTLRITESMNGKVDTTFVVGNPNILAGRIVDNVDRSFQKFVTAVAEVGTRKGTATEWAVVTGAKPRLGAQFVTEAKTDVPLWVLRDPPGDQSYAYIEKGSQVCNTFVGSVSVGFSAGASVEIEIGAEVDVGAAFGGEASVALTKKEKFKVGLSGGNTISGGGGAKLCATTEERISTFNDEDYFGDQADVFVGAGLNLIFAKADQLTINESGGNCSVSLTQSTVLGPELETAFHYTRDEIKNRVIPRLENLRDNPADGAPQQVNYNSAIKNWESMLTRADLIAARNDLESFGDDQNISFSAGAEYESAYQNDKTVIGFVENEAFLKLEAGMNIELEVAGNGVELDFTSELEVKLNFRWDREETSSTKYGYVLFDDDVGDSYTIDVFRDPQYGTPVYDVRAGFSSCPFEPWYDTPEVTAGGASSTTPQPRTASRDNPKLSINPPSLSDVDPTKPAVFTLTIGNESASSEERNIRLGQLLTSNPGGAIVRASGLPLNTGESGSQHFIVPSGQSQEVTLEVMRGPNKYKYERLGIVAYPPCEEGNLLRGRPWIADTLYFDVAFKAPCSDINIFRPKDRWALNRTTKSSPLEVVLNNFTLSGTDNSDGLTEVGLQYRKAGDQDWTPGFVASKATITVQGGASATSYTKSDWVFPGVDGAYEFRAYAMCANGTTYSDVINGSVDTKRPEVLGTPEPADQVLSLGDDIKVQFDEAIACSSVITSGSNLNTTLRFPGGANIATKATCDGSALTLVPTDPAFFDSQEGVLMEASVSGVTDAAGNPMLNPSIPGSPTEGPATWQFTVAQSSVAWSPVNHHVTVPFGESQIVTVNLVNGTAQEATFALEHATNDGLAAHMDLALLDNSGNPTTTVTDLTPSTTQGTLVAKGSQPITFTLPNSLALGSYRGQILARAVQNSQPLGKVPFTLNVDVVCQAPTHTITPTDFEHNMTAMLRLFVSEQESQDVNDVVVAYVDNEVRGVANVQEIATGTFRVPLVIYSNPAAGERVTLQVYDASACKLYNETSRTFTFQADLARGTPNKPIVLDAPPRPSTDVALAAGWTWVSVNKTPAGGDLSVNNLLRDLGEVESGAGDLIKSQTQFSLFDQGSNSWLGSLGQLQPGRAYQVKMGQSTTLKVTGTAVDLNSHSVTLNQGWTWLGYSAQEALFINDALGFNTNTNQNIPNVGVPNPDEADIIKSQFGFAQYVNSIGWVGSLDRLEPGRGYLLRTRNGGTLTYPDPSGFTNKPGASTRLLQGGPAVAAHREQAASSEAQVRMSTAEITDDDNPAETVSEQATTRHKRIPQEEETTSRMHLSETAIMAGPGWLVDPIHYSHSMGLVATMEIDAFALESEGAAIAATIDDEVRGVGRLQYVEALDAYRAFLLIYGAVEETRNVSFLLYDDETKRVVAATNTVAFEANAIVGSVTDPVVLSDTVPVAEEAISLPTTFALDANYPNPFNPETVIRYAVPEAIAVEVVVYDVLGREVMTLVNEEQQAGRYTLTFDGSGLSSGVYVYRMKAGSFVQSHRMVLLK